MQTVQGQVRDTDEFEPHVGGKVPEMRWQQAGADLLPVLREDGWAKLIVLPRRLLGLCVGELWLVRVSLVEQRDHMA